MTSLAYAAADSATMLRRNLRHALRYPSMTISTAATPVIFLLLFNYVLGGTLGAGLRGAGEGVSDDEVAAMAIDGGAQGYVRVAAALIAATFGEASG